jgi:hypothetical protein
MGAEILMPMLSLFYGFQVVNTRIGMFIANWQKMETGV